MPSARPETRYTKSGGLNIAYQVVGDGPLDLIYVPGWISNVELNWEEPAHAHVLERLAGFARLILFDKRGTGLSDPVPLDRLPTLEERMDDVRAVLDAVECEQAALFGFSEGGLMSILFAATYPERITALALYGTFAKRIKSPDYPWAPSPEDRGAGARGAGAELGRADGPRPARAFGERRVQGSSRHVLPPQRQPRHRCCLDADEHADRRARRAPVDPGADPRHSSQGRPRREGRGEPFHRRRGYPERGSSSCRETRTPCGPGIPMRSSTRSRSS